MEMSFEGDGRDYQRTRRELLERFEAWTQRQGVDAEPSTVELLLDWKVGYGDGRLDRWDATDVEGFLLEWYPRKVSAPPGVWPHTPPSVAAYVDFLAHEGLLAPGSSPAAVRKHAKKVTPAFLRKMGDPRNFGMAKSVVGGDDSVVPEDLLARLAEMTGTSPEMLLDALSGDEQPLVGPVRRPSDGEVVAAVGGARALRQVRALASACAQPGLVAPDDGDLGTADALRLVTELGTGDGVEGIKAAADLPELDWLVGLAREAGAVERVRGRLVAVDGFTGLPDVEAHSRLVHAAFQVGVGDEYSDDDGLAEALLARVLSEGDTGVPADALFESIGDVTEMFDEWAPESAEETVDRSEFLVERLIGLGLLARGSDDMITSSAAGRAVGTEILTEAGMEVVWRVDPETAAAADLTGTLIMLEEDDAAADLAAWWAAHPAGVDDLVAAILDGDLVTGAVLALLEMAASVIGPPVEAAAREHRNGPREALVTMWLLTRGALDPASVDPAQMLNGTVEIAAAMLDEEGPEGVVEFFDTDPQQTAEVLEHLWRAEHGRTADVLDALGRHHPDKKVAKAARKTLMKLRNR